MFILVYVEIVQLSKEEHLQLLVNIFEDGCLCYFNCEQNTIFIVMVYYYYATFNYNVYMN